MKKLKLTLNKETIAQLNDENLDAVKGGTKVPETWYQTCPATCGDKKTCPILCVVPGTYTPSCLPNCVEPTVLATCPSNAC